MGACLRTGAGLKTHICPGCVGLKSEMKVPEVRLNQPVSSRRWVAPKGHLWKSTIDGCEGMCDVDFL